MIKPADGIWRESMEILAMERIRGMNIGMLARSPARSGTSEELTLED
jgi:hypothetical protein